MLFWFVIFKNIKRKFSKELSINFIYDTYLFLAVLSLPCCTKAFSGCSKQRLFSSCGVWASHCSGFSCGTPALSSWASVTAAHGLSSCIPQALECGLSSCGTKALVACSMWHLSRPRIKPVYPALAGRFLSTVLPGKSFIILIKYPFGPY